MITIHKEKNTVNIRFEGDTLASIGVSHKSLREVLSSCAANNIEAPKSSYHQMQIEALGTGWKISAVKNGSWQNWHMKFSPSALIFPTREGEFITSPKKIPIYQSYHLSYPGTASTKCIVVFLKNDLGFVLGAEPSLDYAKLSLTHLSEDIFIYNLLQNMNSLYLIPFHRDWEAAVKEFANIFELHKLKVNNKLLNKPRFLLQMGVRDFYGNAYIKDFGDLFPMISEFATSLGEGNIVHLFGTNELGFDCMFPDFTIDGSLGGESSFAELIKKIHKLGLYVSHHFNPRICDARWLHMNPKYKDCIVLTDQGFPWVEFYKNNVYFVVNSNKEKWQEFCLGVIKKFRDLGVDYVEIDQIAYQRNLYTEEGGLGHGYQELIDATKQLGVKFWVEGVSDIYKLADDCYYQVLPRDRFQLWENGENRRGYVYGTAFTKFYRTLVPEANISFQLVTEKAKVKLLPKRLKIMKDLNVQVYDLELGFVDEKYQDKFKKVMTALKFFKSAV